MGQCVYFFLLDCLCIFGVYFVDWLFIYLCICVFVCLCVCCRRSWLWRLWCFYFLLFIFFSSWQFTSNSNILLPSHPPHPTPSLFSPRLPTSATPCPVLACQLDQDILTNGQMVLWWPHQYVCQHKNTFVCFLIGWVNRLRIIRSFVPCQWIKREEEVLQREEKSQEESQGESQGESWEESWGESHIPTSRCLRKQFVPFLNVCFVCMLMSIIHTIHWSVRNFFVFCFFFKPRFYFPNIYFDHSFIIYIYISSLHVCLNNIYHLTFRVQK